ncbi:MAG TPA: hypothetical protein VD999_02935 [Vitreimonas sp.]|nr:hypothetical protein [Vitreimonas sp.]
MKKSSILLLIGVVLLGVAFLYGGVVAGPPGPTDPFTPPEVIKRENTEILITQFLLLLSLVLIGGSIVWKMIEWSGKLWRRNADHNK